MVITERKKKGKKIVNVDYVIRPPTYTISLTFGDKTIMGIGATVLEALQAMPVPVKIVSKGLLKITNGVKKFEQSWQPSRLKRLFQPLAQRVQAKQLSYLLK